MKNIFIIFFTIIQGLVLNTDQIISIYPVNGEFEGNINSRILTVNNRTIDCNSTPLETWQELIKNKIKE